MEHNQGRTYFAHFPASFGPRQLFAFEKLEKEFWRVQYKHQLQREGQWGAQERNEKKKRLIESMLYYTCSKHANNYFDEVIKIHTVG